MRIVGAAVAIAVGLLVLAGYFVSPLAGLQNQLLNWGMILAGVAALMGVFNLITVHGAKIRAGSKGSIYSALLILSLFLTFVLALFLRPVHPIVQTLFNGVILPVEATLMAIISVSLIFMAIHLLRRGLDLTRIVFLVTVLLVLVGSISLPFGQIPLLGDTFRPWINQVLSMGGARGILIGVALGSLATGLRVLLGFDRPYGGK